MWHEGKQEKVFCDKSKKPFEGGVKEPKRHLAREHYKWHSMWKNLHMAVGLNEEEEDEEA